MNMNNVFPHFEFDIEVGIEAMLGTKSIPRNPELIATEFVKIRELVPGEVAADCPRTIQTWETFWGLYAPLVRKKGHSMTQPLHSYSKKTPSRSEQKELLHDLKMPACQRLRVQTS